MIKTTRHIWSTVKEVVVEVKNLWVELKNLYNNLNGRICKDPLLYKH